MIDHAEGLVIGMRTGRAFGKGLRLLAAALWLASVLFLSGWSEAEKAAAYGSPAVSSSPNTELQHLYESLRAGQRPDPNIAYEKPERPTVYLTFDDGPSKLTGQVLDILKEEDVKATFFVIGQLAGRQPETVRRIAEEGHALGNHTYNHVYKELYQDFSGFWQQVQKSEAIIEQAAGVKPELLRAPGGTYMNFDAFYFYLLERVGYTVVDWNVDSGDAARQGVPADDIVRAVRSSPLEHELVVLLHDGAGHEQTVQALPEIIRFYKEKGYAFAPLSASVKPVQFALGHSRWNRSMSLTAFSDLQRQAAESGSERATLPAAARENEERLMRQALLAAGEAEAELEKQALLPLTVMLDAGRWVMGPQEYEFRYDRFAVPLRSFIERIGGKVVWDERKRLAVVHVGGKSVEYDLVGRTIRERFPTGGTKIPHLADISLVDGEIRVPLRATVELFGGRVNEYRVEKDVRSVAVAVTDGLLFVQMEADRVRKSFYRV